MFAIVALLLQVSTPVPQTPPAPPPPLHGGPQTMTCPIGGESFSALVGSHYSEFGMPRPDGLRASSWLMPRPIPECPSNGLVLIEQYDAATVAKLRPLIDSDAYRAMAKNDTTYYRASWIATRLGRTEPQALWLLLLATWQVKPQMTSGGQAMSADSRAIAYQAEFARRVAALPGSTGATDLLWLRGRAANALREIGRFDEAEAMRRSAQTQLGAPNADARYWPAFLDGLRVAIARRDRAVEPIDMVDANRAAWLCLDRERGGSAFERGFCADPARAEAISKMRRMREQVEKASPRPM
ncbi:MAG: hypothetical protein V4537_13710 [Pseudomonadota bacterium]